MPAVQQGIGERRHLRHDQGPPGADQGDHLFPEALQTAKKLDLSGGKRNGAQALGLAAAVGALAQGHNDHIGRAGLFHRLIQQRGALQPHPAAQRVFQTLGDGDDILRKALRGPGAKQGLLFPEHGAHGIYLLGRQGQKPGCIFQQHNAPGGKFPGQGPMLRTEDHLVVGPLLGIGVFEQSQPEFDPEDAINRLVDGFLADLSLGYQGGEVLNIADAEHIHVHTGIDRQAGGLLPVRGHSLMNELGHRVPVGDDKPLEAEILLQNFRQQMAAGGDGGAVVFVEGRHHRQGAGVHAAFEGGQIGVAQGVFADLYAFVVPAALCRAVAHIVLTAGGDPMGMGGVLSLESPDGGGAHPPGQVRVLAEALGDPAPPGVPGNVHHGGIGPVDAVGDGLPGGHGREILGELFVKGRRLAQGDGTGGAVAVNDVGAVDEGNAQPGLLYGDALAALPVLQTAAELVLVACQSGGGVDEGAHPAGPDLRLNLGNLVAGQGDFIELSDFFL